VTTTRTVVSLPVHVLALHEVFSRYQIDLSQPVVSVTVHGPENLLHALHPDTDLIAYVNLSQLPQPGIPVDVPVTVIAPPQISSDAVTIRVTISMLQQPAAPVLTSPTPTSTPAANARDGRSR
jgi:hypothetical protein